MKTVRINVNHASGLHARPAATFVAEAMLFNSEIKIRNLTTQSDWVDAKSILGVLTLGVEKGHEIEISAEGVDEEEVITSLERLFRTEFEGKR